MVVGWLVLIFGSFGYRAPQNAVVLTSLVLASALISGALYLIVDMDAPFVVLFSFHQRRSSEWWPKYEGKWISSERWRLDAFVRHCWRSFQAMVGKEGVLLWSVSCGSPWLRWKHSWN
jgi:hypothetical protein